MQRNKTEHGAIDSCLLQISEMIGNECSPDVYGLLNALFYKRTVVHFVNTFASHISWKLKGLTFAKVLFQAIHVYLVLRYRS